MSTRIKLELIVSGTGAATNHFMDCANGIIEHPSHIVVAKCQIIRMAKYRLHVKVVQYQQLLIFLKNPSRPAEMACPR